MENSSSDLSGSPSATQDIRVISLNQIRLQDPTNGRLIVDDRKVEILSRSIAQVGLFNPITVRSTENDFELLAGHHRLLAFKRLGRSTIPAHVVRADDTQARIIRLSENVIRSNLSPVEEAHQLAALIEQDPEGVDGVSTKIGRSTGWILDRLDIVSWPDSLMQHVHMGKISLSAARRLARIQPADVRESYIRDAVLNGINARTASLWLQQSQSIREPDCKLSEKISKKPQIEYETTTKTNCFVCSTMKDLSCTHAVRICNECVELIHQSAHEQEQNHPPQPPTTTEGK